MAAVFSPAPATSQQKMEEELAVNLLPPTSPLSEYLELFVNCLLDNLKQRVYVRVVSNITKPLRLNAQVGEFLSKYDIPDVLPYRSKVIFAFQKTDNGLVAFFGLYLQEYGDECPLPNRNKVYISMIDSVNIFEPASLKRKAIYGLLAGYLNYLRSENYETVFLWACPSANGDEYIFRGRPKTQRNPTAEILENWYIQLMEYCVGAEILEKYECLAEWCPRESVSDFFTNFPLFLEDHWLSEMEGIIDSLRSLMWGPSGPKKKKMRFYKSEEPAKQSSVESDIAKHRYVFKKITGSLDKYRNGFYALSLKQMSMEEREIFSKAICEAETGYIFVDSRDDIVKFFEENDLQFCDVQAAEKATKQMLMEIWDQMSYICCDICGQEFTEGFTCEACKIDLCQNCVNTGFDHPHPLLTVKSVSFSSSDTPSTEQLLWEKAKLDWWSEFVNCSERSPDSFQSD